MAEWIRVLPSGGSQPREGDRVVLRAQSGQSCDEGAQCWDGGRVQEGFLEKDHLSRGLRPPVREKVKKMGEKWGKGEDMGKGHVVQTRHSEPVSYLSTVEAERKKRDTESPRGEAGLILAHAHTRRCPGVRWR